MKELASFRHLLIEVSCDRADHPMSWEKSTTLPDDQVERAALETAALICRDESPGHERTHKVTLTVIPEVSTGARRG